MEKKCKNCVFWEQAPEKKWSECNKESTLFEIEIDVLDDSGLTEYLRTSPEFGCVEWEGVVKEATLCTYCKENDCVPDYDCCKDCWDCDK